MGPLSVPSCPQPLGPGIDAGVQGGEPMTRRHAPRRKPLARRVRAGGRPIKPAALPPEESPQEKYQPLDTLTKDSSGAFNWFWSLAPQQEVTPVAVMPQLCI